MNLFEDLQKIFFYCFRDQTRKRSFWKGFWKGIYAFQVTFNVCIRCNPLIFFFPNLVNSHPPANSSLSYDNYLRSKGESLTSSETYEATQLFELLFMLHHRAALHPQRKALSALYYIHELTDTWYERKRVCHAFSREHRNFAPLALGHRWLWQHQH